MAAHYMEEVEQLCDRILIMDKGKALALAKGCKAPSYYRSSACRFQP